MTEPLVHIASFRMDFGDKTVVRDLSFDVIAGETFGFLGSNGSGKTTTLRALLGIYQPTGGVLHIDGKVFEPRDGARLGYLPEERGLYKKEPVLDVLEYFGRLGAEPGLRLDLVARLLGPRRLGRQGLHATGQAVPPNRPTTHWPGSRLVSPPQVRPLRCAHQRISPTDARRYACER